MERTNNVLESKTKTNANTQNNEQWVYLAKLLANIVLQKIGITNTPAQHARWADDIRKLNQINKVSVSRIERALIWYSDNAGEKYVPVIESGHSLRTKFSKLEAAIRRAEDDYDETINSDKLAQRVTRLEKAIKNINNSFDDVYDWMDDTDEWIEDVERWKKTVAAKTLYKLTNKVRKLNVACDIDDRCPHGHTFGEDFEKFDDCEACGDDAWDACEVANREEGKKTEDHPPAPNHQSGAGVPVALYDAQGKVLAQYESIASAARKNKTLVRDQMVISTMMHNDLKFADGGCFRRTDKTFEIEVKKRPQD